MTFILVFQQLSRPKILMQRPVLHNVEEAFVYKFTFAFTTETQSPMQFCAPTLLGTFHVVAGIASIT